MLTAWDVAQAWFARLTSIRVGPMPDADLVVAVVLVVGNALRLTEAVLAVWRLAIIRDSVEPARVRFALRGRERLELGPAASRPAPFFGTP